jgi:hypothetical protein
MDMSREFGRHTVGGRRAVLLLLGLSLAVALSAWPTAADPTAGDEIASGTHVTGVQAGADRGELASASQAQPCLLRADCAGGGLLAGPPLLLVVPAIVAMAVVLMAAGRVAPPRLLPRPLVLADDLDHPPQTLT